jgi:gamma-glutamyltranspeptidase / glutathione hydrolase
MQTTRPELWGTFGMVSSTHHLATAAGMAVLEAGGTAVDAAVATGFALQVAEPHLNGPGGDMSLLFAGPDGLPTVLCGQGPAPAGATIEHYRAQGLDLVPGAGLLAAAVPGSTVAWLTLLRDHGTFALPDVLQYAVHLAEGGIPVLPAISSAVERTAGLFTAAWPTSAAVYMPDGRAPRPWEVLRNPVLGNSYRRLLAAAGAAGAGREQQIDGAIRAWTEGFVAEAVDSFARTALLDSSGQAHPGVITGADLAGWRPAYEPPVTARYGEWTVAKTGPWGQGPVLLLQLRMLERLGLDPRWLDDGEHGADALHLITEVSKLAFADRDAWFGDSGPDGPEILQALLSDGYVDSRIALIGPAADAELRPGRPLGRTPRLPAFETAGGAADLPAGGDPTVARSGVVRGDTCHLDVVDRWGNTVAATPSGGWLQSSPVIPTLGFPLGSRLQMTTLEPGLPASLQPGRRPRTTLSPSMALRDGRVELAFGTPGGDQQDQWQLPLFLRAVTGQRLQQAVDAPNFHHNHMPSSFHPREARPTELVVEERWGSAVVDDLRSRGHDVVVSGPWTLGRLCAVRRDPEGALLHAAADPRSSQAYAAGR